MNPWVHQTVAVLAAAFAMNGRANVPAAATASEPRNTERLVVLIIAVFLSSLLAPRVWPPARRGGALSEANIERLRAGLKLYSMLIIASVSAVGVAR